MTQQSDIPSLLFGIATNLERLEHELAEARQAVEQACTFSQLSIWSSVICAVVILVGILTRY